MNTVTRSKNKGFITEDDHFDKLKTIFGEDNVSSPKNSGKGSDFVVHYKDKVISFESKTNVTDIFDAGVIGCYSNGLIINASTHLKPNQLISTQSLINKNAKQLEEYCKITKIDKFPHSIPVELFDEAKQSNSLVHIYSSNVIRNAIETTFTRSHNKFIKANYIIIGDHVYNISNNQKYDPLNLLTRDCFALTDEHIDACSIRTGRSGSNKGKVSVGLRLQFRLNSRKVAPSPITFENLVI